MIKRDNRIIQAHSLPTIMNFNMRSFFPKQANFCDDLEERQGDVVFITEIWEKKENKKHQNKIKEMLEMRGITYISTPRPVKRGGGSAIAVRNQKFSISKLNINIPKGIEITWGLVKPKAVTGEVSEFVAFTLRLSLRKENS